VEFLPHGKFGKAGSRGIGGARAYLRRSGRQRWGRVAVLASAATMVSMVLPAGIGRALIADDVHDDEIRAALADRVSAATAS